MSFHSHSGFSKVDKIIELLREFLHSKSVDQIEFRSKEMLEFKLFCAKKVKEFLFRLYLKLTAQVIDQNDVFCVL